MKESIVVKDLILMGFEPKALWLKSMYNFYFKLDYCLFAYEVLVSYLQVLAQAFSVFLMRL